MSTPLCGASIVDFVRGYASLSPATTIPIQKDGAPFTGGLFKSIGSEHIDFGDGTSTQRYPLSGAFTRLYLDTAANKINLYLAGDTTVV